MNKQSARIDTLLEPLLRPTSNERVDELFSRLIAEHAEPLIRGIVRYKLHLSPHNVNQKDEADDIYHEVVVQLLTDLNRLREQPETHPISDLRGLAAVIAHRTCSRWMRRQFPERHALKNRLYYLLTRHRDFALWENENKRMVAGLAEWQCRKKTAGADRIEQLSDQPGLLAQIETLKNNQRSEALGDFLADIFNFAGEPIEFDLLVTKLAGWLRIRDHPLESIDKNEDGSGFAAAAQNPDVAWQVEKRIFLQRLWEELRQLPLGQRAALLLNLRDAEGRGCISLFPVTGVATLSQMADVLEMSADTLAELWNQLPLEDARIAELLRLTRQQVINARKSGRERLRRRLKGFI